MQIKDDTKKARMIKKSASKILLFCLIVLAMATIMTGCSTQEETAEMPVNVSKYVDDIPEYTEMDIDNLSDME